MEENKQDQPTPAENLQEQTPPEEKELNTFERIINVFFSPVKAFQSINRKPTWVVAFIVVCLFTIGFELVHKDLIMQERIKQFEMSDRLDADAIERQIESTQNFSKPPLLYFSFLIVFIGTLVVYLIVSGVLIFTGNVILGGEGKFKNILAMYVYASFITVGGLILKTPLILTKKSLDIQTSLSVFMDSASSGGFLYKFLSHIDVFAGWQVAAVAIGFGIIYKFEFKKSLTVIIILQLIYSVLAAALGSVFSGFGV